MILKNCMNRTLLATVALAFSSVTASASTITVCASGCDYTSINAAIGAASDGDVIQLAAETYFEGEQIDTLGKAITLRGVLDKAGEPASVLDGRGSPPDNDLRERRNERDGLRGSGDPRRLRAALGVGLLITMARKPGPRPQSV